MEKCKCSLRERAVGDGCSFCNTTEYIDMLPTPADLAEELDFGFSDDQATFIARDVYQPLLDLAKILSTKIDNLEAKSGKG